MACVLIYPVWLAPILNFESEIKMWCMVEHGGVLYNVGVCHIDAQGMRLSSLGMQICWWDVKKLGDDWHGDNSCMRVRGGRRDTLKKVIRKYEQWLCRSCCNKISEMPVLHVPDFQYISQISKFQSQILNFQFNQSCPPLRPSPLSIILSHSFYHTCCVCTLLSVRVVHSGEEISIQGWFVSVMEQRGRI